MTHHPELTPAIEPMKKRRWAPMLPEDCLKWLEHKEAMTGDAKSEIVKNLIRKAMSEEQQQGQVAS